MAAQLAQGDAGIGLRDAELVRCARDALGLVDLSEDVEPSDIELGHGISE